MPFHHTVTVRFSEVDGAGIAYFSRVFEYCHAAYEELLRAGDVPLQRLLAEESWVLPLVHAEADFKRPLRLGDRVRVEVAVSRLGRTSVHYAYRLVGEEGTTRATAELVHAFIDKESQRPRPIPESFAAALGRLGLLPE
ncbi:MAG: acyl-CoA thioesterase [Alphaproteobacteria bacterium]|nr:acyl-CoA thioesterase [Alphaproteobacteria bacterium]